MKAEWIVNLFGIVDSKDEPYSEPIATTSPGAPNEPTHQQAHPDHRRHQWHRPRNGAPVPRRGRACREQWDEAGFDRTLAINLKGPYFLVQALLPLFANPSSVVLNTSINAHIGMPSSSVYAASKAGLISLARTMSGELIGRGIRVNAVSPGPVTTPIYGKLGMDADALQQMVASIRAQIPAGRFGEPREIAKAIVFLASDESTFTVGSELIIDGGMSAI